MANPRPEIVFEVNLSALDVSGHLNPDMHTESADTGRNLIENKKTQRSTFIPGLMAGSNYELKHGETFTEYGQKALYLKNTYALSKNPILKVVSEV